MGSWAIGLVAAHVPLVDVFSKGESGYFCIKIPYLTSMPGGRLLALAEGREKSCSDYTRTDLVMKTSADDGQVCRSKSPAGCQVEGP